MREHPLLMQERRPEAQKEQRGDPVYRAEVRAERAQRNKISAMLGAMFALGAGAMDEWTYRQT